MTTTLGAFEQGRAQGLEEAAELLHARARNLIVGKRRTNAIDRHTGMVLTRARDDIRAMKRMEKSSAAAPSGRRG